MNYRKIFWGVLLIVIGALIVLKNLGVFYFSWWSIIRLWPVVLVLWGISLIPVKDWIKLCISLVTILIAVLLVVQYERKDHDDFSWFNRPFHHWNWNNDDWDKYKEDHQTDKEWKTQTLQEPFDSTIVYAELNLDAAAGAFQLTDTTTELIYFDRQGYWGDYSMTSEDIDDKAIISLTLQNSHVNLPNEGHKVNIKLNKTPMWDFNFDIGAASINFDLSNYKTRSIDIDGGAASITVKLGDRYYETNMSIDAGASSLVIEIPENSGCEVQANTVLSSRNLDGFSKTGDRTFQTDNFQSSGNKIYITIDAAVSSLTVNRYQME
jgi:hypothetical protein